MGRGCEGVQVGSRVACAGNQYAFHAEVNWVPERLCVPVPDSVSSRSACFATVGAVAMQGVRQCRPELGEVAVVIGLGLVGQLISQLLQAAGVHVFGVDKAPERCRLAEALGAQIAVEPTTEGYALLKSRVAQATADAGADCVVIASGGTSNDPVERAEIARDRARVVDVGKTRLIFRGMLTTRRSWSFGSPGRTARAGTTRCMDRGVDYPIGYVRLTEQRNMMSFLALVGAGKVCIDPLVAATVPFGNAVDAYTALLDATSSGVATVFDYADAPVAAGVVSPIPVPAERDPRRPRRMSESGSSEPGGTPRRCSSPALRGIRSSSWPPLRRRRRSPRATLCGSSAWPRDDIDYREVLDDESIDALLPEFVGRRHALTAVTGGRCRGGGKAVFVEKPLALSEAELGEISRAVMESGNNRLAVGYNRRFAPSLLALREEWGQASSPAHIQYTVNAGELESESWYGDRVGEGSRLVGEGGHFIDTMSWWLGARPTRVMSAATSGDSDDAMVVVAYADGSVGSLAYYTHGPRGLPKERLLIVGIGKAAELDNFRSAAIWSTGRRRVVWRRRGGDKGHAAAIEAFVDAVRSGSPMPIDFGDLVATSLATFAAVRSAVSGRTEPVDTQSEPDEAVGAALNGSLPA